MKKCKMWLALVLVCSMVLSLFVPAYAYGIGESLYEVNEFQFGKIHGIEKPEDVQKVITSCDELQTFINEDLQTHCDAFDYLDEEEYGKLLTHLQSLDDAFFQENVYVAVIAGNFTKMDTLWVREFSDVGTPEEELYGKSITIQYGDGFTCLPAIPGTIFGGVAIPKADLEGKEIVEIIVTDQAYQDPPTEPTEEPTQEPENTPTPTNTPETYWYENFQYEIYNENKYGNEAVRIVGFKPSGVEREAVVIPERINYMWVREIGDHVFCEVDTVESVTIPNRLIAIADHAFDEEAEKPIIICGHTDSVAYEYAMHKGIPFSSTGKNLPTNSKGSYIKCLGNVNKKDALSATDSLEILKYVVKLTTEIDEELADANQDHVIDAKDALFVLECVVGLKEKPIETPSAYDVYKFEFGMLEGYNWKPDYSIGGVTADSWHVIHNVEELQAFEEYLTTYCTYTGAIDEVVFETALMHFDSMDEEFFQENVYVATLTGTMYWHADFVSDCLTNVTEKGTVTGKTFTTVFGDLYGRMGFGPTIPCGVYSGTVIPRSDLDGVDIVDVIVTER